MPAKPGSTPAASIPFVPRLRCTVISEYVPVEAECTQCSFPATRNPVSPKCTAGAAVILSRTNSRNPFRPPAARGGSGHGALRDRGAEQLGQGSRRAFLRQELSHVEIDDDRGDPRPVLHRRGHTVR